jgi:hypothetical protein
MRRLLLALPFALLPLVAAQAHDEKEHGSLGTHEHGTAKLNAALDGATLMLELDSPAMNLVGFEHPATTDTDKATLAAARARLEKPLGLFQLTAKAGCTVANQKLASPLFGDAPAADDDDDDHAAGEADHHEHSDIHASYEFTCASPDALNSLNLTQLFKAFPGTHKVVVQMIAPSGQKGLEATPDNSTLKF